MGEHQGLVDELHSLCLRVLEISRSHQEYDPGRGDDENEDSAAQMYRATLELVSLAKRAKKDRRRIASEALWELEFIAGAF